MFNIFILLRGSSICYIPDGMIIQGSMDLKVPGYIYGTVEGDIKSTAKICIGISGVINGNVNAKEIVINGTVDGNVFAVQKAIIKKNAIVKGRVNASPIVLEKEGVILGKVNASEDEILESMKEINAASLIDKNEQSEAPPVAWF